MEIQQLTSSTKLSEIEIVIQWIQIESSRYILHRVYLQIEKFPNLVMQFHNLKPCQPATDISA